MRDHHYHKRIIVVAVVAVVPMFLGSCNHYKKLKRAQHYEEIEDWDQAVLHYMGLLQSDPANVRYKAGLVRAKVNAANLHFDKARKYIQAAALERALVELQQAVELNPTHQYAKAELDKVRSAIESRRRGEETATVEELKQAARKSRAQPPVLNPLSDQPIDLNFPEPTPVRDIYHALGKAFGINVLFDAKLGDPQIAIELKAVTARNALELLMRAAGHFYKVVDQHSILIINDTPPNRRLHQDLVIQTFFLSNSDATETVNMVRSLLGSNKVAVNKRLNAIVVRDTVDKVRIAERIIETNDKAQSEVVIDVELLQINTSKLQNLGLSLDNNQVQATLDTGGGVEGQVSSGVRLPDLEFLNANDWSLTLPSFIYQFIKSHTEAQTLARPQLRISERKKAELRIGDRVPIPVTSFQTSNTVGGNVVPITSFQYEHVGITIILEPRVHHNEEVSLDIQVEVRNLSGSIGAQPIIGNRSIDTTIRLKDGETNFLAGLIRTDYTTDEEGIPGLSDIPVLGRLFSRKQHSRQRTDIVLTLTPHIVRKADITEEDLLPLWVGPESHLSFAGDDLRAPSQRQGPFDGGEGPSPAEVEDQIRRRLERLPRGLSATRAARSRTRCRHRPPASSWSR